MPRREFPRTVKVAVVKRATRNSILYCEKCELPAKKWQIDHINPDGITGEPVITNAMLLCEPCHAEKTKHDVANIAKAKRREAAHLGVRPAPKLKGPKFHRAAPQRTASRPLTRTTNCFR